jgi:hypothetical protein
MLNTGHVLHGRYRFASLRGLVGGAPHLDKVDRLCSAGCKTLGCHNPGVRHDGGG